MSATGVVDRELYVKMKEQRDALLAAAKDAKKYLERDLVEPGRSVFWNLVAAIHMVEPAERPAAAEKKQA
jgi:hypothetical protein